MKKSLVKSRKQKRKSQKNDGSLSKSIQTHVSPTFSHKLWSNKAAHKAAKKKFYRSMKKLGRGAYNVSGHPPLPIRSPRTKTQIYSPNQTREEAVRSHADAFQQIGHLNRSRDRIINNRILENGGIHRELLHKLNAY